MLHLKVPYQHACAKANADDPGCRPKTRDCRLRNPLHRLSSAGHISSVTDLLINKCVLQAFVVLLTVGHQARQKLTLAIYGDVDKRAFRLLASSVSSGSMKLFTVAGLSKRSACKDMCCSRVSAAVD